MNVLIDSDLEQPADEALLKWIDGVVRQGVAQTDGPADVQVGVSLTDDEGIRELNREFRGLDRSTDVLSFPMLGYDEQGRVEDTSLDTDPQTGEVLLGDIVVSVETARRQALEYGHSFEREMGFLLIHGVLHLRGYDHVDEAGEALMGRKAEEILHDLRLERA